MTPLARVVALGWPLLLLASGLALVDLVQGDRPLRPQALRLGVAYPCGLAFTAIIGHAASHLLGAAIGPAWALGLPLLPLALRLLRVRALPLRPVHLARLAETRVLVAAAVFVTTALIVDGVSTPLTDWDGRMTWAAQGRYIAEAQGVDAPVLREARWVVIHPQYPLLLPLAQAMELTLAGSLDDRIVRPLYAAFLPSLVLIAWGAARRLGRRAAAFAAAQVLVAPFVPFATHGGAAGAYSDLPLACFVGAGMALLAAGGRGPLVGLMLAASVLTKNEGLFLSAVVLAAFVPAALGGRAATRRQRVARLLVAGAVAALATLLLFHWRAGIVSRFDDHYPRPGLAPLLAAVYALPTVVPCCVALMVKPAQWGYLFWVAPLVLATGAAGVWRRALVPYALVLLGAWTMYAAAYGFCGDPVYLTSVTWDRFVLQMLVPILVILAAAFTQTLRVARSAS